MYEISNVLHQYAKKGVLHPLEVDEAFGDIIAQGIDLHGDVHLHRRAILFAREFSLPATYDAHYLALAERFGAEFWTVDGRLARSVQPQLPWVHLVA